MFSRIFIYRPVFAMVISIFIVIPAPFTTTKRQPADSAWLSEDASLDLAWMIS